MPELFCRMPLRKGDTATDWRVVQKYIKKNFNKINVSATLERMNDLRKQIILMALTKSSQVEGSEALAETVVKPYLLLVRQAQAHLPICSGEVSNLTFVWRDLWDESLKRTSNNSNVELAACLMNLAALLTATGAQQAALGAVESIKAAFQSYQQAAGVYSLVFSFHSKRFSANDIVGDLCAPSLTFLQEYCLAQAHQCSYLKAEKELTGKPALLSKIAMEGAKLYAGLESSARALGFKHATSFLCDYASIAHRLFTARAHYHLGMDQLGKEEMGEALGRFNAALDALKDARANSQSIDHWVSEVRSQISSQQRTAQNQNDTVYFSRIQRNVPLPEGLGKGMGKPVPMGHLLVLPANTTGEADAPPDPFKGIFPPSIKTAATVFRTQMQEKVLNCSAAMQSHRVQLRGCLSELGVVCAIESVEEGASTGGRVPDSLRRRIQGIRKEKLRGGSKKLMDVLIGMLQHIANLREASASNIQEIEQVLDAEAAEDAKYRVQFGEKIWGNLRQPSHTLPDAVSLRKFISEARAVMQSSVIAPSEEIKSRMNDRLKDLGRLDWPMEDLDAIMPYSKSAGATQHSAEMRADVERLRAIVTHFDEVEQQESQTMNLLQELLRNFDVEESLCATPTEQHEETLKAAEEKFTVHIDEIHAQMKELNAMLEEAQDVMVKIAQGRSKDPVEEEMQLVINGLESACSLYDALYAQLTDLSTVTAGLVDRSESSLSMAQSFAASRNLEAMDFKESMDAEIAAKAKELAKKRAGEEEASQSKSRQEELQRQIRELEAMQAARPKPALPQPQQQQPPPQQSFDPPPPYTGPPSVPSQPANQLDAIFGVPPLASGPPQQQPYMYSQPPPAQPMQHQPYPYPQHQQHQPQMWQQQAPQYGGAQQPHPHHPQYYGPPAQQPGQVHLHWAPPPQPGPYAPPFQPPQ